MRYNLATKVMRNGVEVIVATDRIPRPVEAEYLRILSSTVTRPITLAPHTLTNLMSMVLPHDHGNNGQSHLISFLQPTFITRTFYTTYNYLTTILKDNTVAVSTAKTTISNVKTEQYPQTKSTENDIQPTVTLKTSPTLQTEVFHTAYTYLNTFVDGDQPLIMSSKKTIVNTLVGTYDILNEIEPSEVFPTTNTYLKTLEFTKTLTDGTDYQVISTKDIVTQVVVTDKPGKKATVTPTTTDVTKTYFVTYTYFSTYVDGDQTKVKSDVSVSSDVTIEKFYIKPKKTETKTIEKIKKTENPAKVSSAIFPFTIMATKTYLTTFTYFTTLLQGPNSDKAETKVNSRTKVVENIVTETLSPQDFNNDYLIRLNSSIYGKTGSIVATATLKKGDTIVITAYNSLSLGNLYQKYEIKPTKTNIQTETKIVELNQIEQENVQKKATILLAPSKTSSSTSEMKNSVVSKSKIKPTETINNEPTAEALIATKEESYSTMVKPTITMTPATLVNHKMENTQKVEVTTFSYSSSVEPTPALSLPQVATSSIDIVNSVKEEPQEPEVAETVPPKKKQPVKQPTNPMNVSSLLNLNSLGINGMNVLGPVFNAMAELIHNNLNKNTDIISKRNDTVTQLTETDHAVKKPVSNNVNPLLNFVNKFTASTTKPTTEAKAKVTTPRTPVYIPVGSFAQDSEFGESQDTHVVIANRPDKWHEKWTDTHAKNLEKVRPLDNPITILEGGIPISPGQVITTNSDVIIGRPGESGPRPPTFAVKNNIPIDMKPPPPPHIVIQDEVDDFIGQHSTHQDIDTKFKEDLNIIPPRPPLPPPPPPKKHIHNGHGHKVIRPHHNERPKGPIHHKNPHFSKHTRGEYDSGTLDLNPPPVPPPPFRTHDVYKPITINHEYKDDPPPPYESTKNVIPIPVHLGPNQNVENYINPAEIIPPIVGVQPGIQTLNQLHISEPTPSFDVVNPNGVLVVPTIAHIPLNVVPIPTVLPGVERSTGHPFLVNIQPSQVANIVIPHGSSTALIVSGGKQHSLKGEVIDDPSPHPEPETVGFVGAEPVLKIENDDIAPSLHNEVLPVDNGVLAKPSSQENRVILPNHPHLTTEVIKIRPKPTRTDIKGHEQHTLSGQYGHISISGQNTGLVTHHLSSGLSSAQHSGLGQHAHHSVSESQGQHVIPGQFAQIPVSGQHIFAGQNIAFGQQQQNQASQHQGMLYIENHSQQEGFQKGDGGVVSHQNHRLEGQDLKGASGVYFNQNQNIHPQTSIKGGGADVFLNLNHHKGVPNLNTGETNIYPGLNTGQHSQIHEGELFLHQNQHNAGQFLIGTGGVYLDQSQFNQGHNLVKGGSGIYVDISPPGHLPPRPDFNQLPEGHSSTKHQSNINENLSNHQSGIVHDVPLNAQVQLGSGKVKPNPLKEILINVNTNKHDNVPFDNKPNDHKFSETQNHIKRPIDDLPENLSPPPLPKDGSTYRPQRPPFIPPHSTSHHRYPPPHPTVPQPADFMQPPPQIFHKPNHKPLPPPQHSPDPRPVIPIGAGAPQQNYPNPRPEDILIVPNKNRPGSSGVINTIKHEQHKQQHPQQTTNVYTDLDASGTSDPLKTEYGEEIQESISRPLYPGQVPNELHKSNRTSTANFNNNQQDGDTLKFRPNVDNVPTKLKGGKPDNVPPTVYPKPDTQSTTTGSHKQTIQSSVHWSNKNQQTSRPSRPTVQSSGSGDSTFVGSVKKPSGFVHSNKPDTPPGNHKDNFNIQNHKEPSGFVNHKEPSGFVTHKGTNLSNHKDEHLESIKLSPGVKGTVHIPEQHKPLPSGFVVNNNNANNNIRIHAVGPNVLPSGFVKNENSVSKVPSSSQDTTTGSQEHTTFTNANKAQTNIYNKGSGFVLKNNEASSSDVSSVFNVKDKNQESNHTKGSQEQSSKDHIRDSNKVAVGSVHPADPPNQNKQQNRYTPNNRPYIPKVPSNIPQIFHTNAGQDGRPTKPPDVSGPSSIKFESTKIKTGQGSVSNGGVHSTGQVHQPVRNTGTQTRYPSDGSELVKRPSGFTNTKKEETNKISGGFAFEDNVPLPTTENKKIPQRYPSGGNGAGIYSTGSSKIPSGFTNKNETSLHFGHKPNHNYGNKTIHFYDPKPIYDINQEREVTTNAENNVDNWFASNFGGGKTDKAPRPTNVHIKNTTSVPSTITTSTSDVEALLIPPKAPDIKPKPEEVMGLSPPPPPSPPSRRPQRPQRPKPPYKFEIPTTPKSTHTPIAIENDFPPVRSPDFNRKPINPQDIFPPRLPDNFVHHLPEYPGRVPPKPRPQERPTVTSLPIDIPSTSSTTEAHDIYPAETENGEDEDEYEDPYYSASEINGHSKPIINGEETEDVELPPVKPPTATTRPRPSPQPKPSTVYQETSKIRTSENPEPKVPSTTKQRVVPTSEREEISPSSTAKEPIQTTYTTKVSATVSPTISQTTKDWQDFDIITGSETVFDPDQFSNRFTPTISEATEKKNFVTTLISSGATTIFGDLFTAHKKQSFPGSTKSTGFTIKESADFDDDVVMGVKEGSSYIEKTSVTPTPTSVQVHTTTLTVTTTMTTVVHSVGHKPSTKTIVLTKTLISTVFNKVTETKTLVKPTTATIIQTHTIATTKTALVVPTALYPTQSKYPTGGTLKPEIFMADPHAKDTITISVSSSMNKNKNGEDTRKQSGTRLDQSDKDSIMVVMSNKHPDIDMSDDDNPDVVSDDENDINDSRVMVGGVFDANEDKEYKELNKEIECTPGCKAKRNELCQRIEGVMKCVCRPGFARMFPDRPCRPTYTYNMKLMLEKLGSEQISYEKNFAQTATPNMAKLASATKEGLDRMIMQSDLRDIYHGVMVNGFQGKDKKTMVDFYVQLSENTDEAKLMDIFKKTLRTSNYSLGGTELFAAREADNLNAEDFNECLNPKFHDCSEHARCFNLKGTYTCSCKEGYTDLSENNLFPGRVCSDMIGCEYCGYHGACYSKGEGQITCECFHWYSGERCHINLKVLLIALVTIGAILLALLLVCAVLTCLNRKSRSSKASRTNGYLRYRGPGTQSIDRRAMIGDSSSESSVDNLPYLSPPPPLLPAATMSAKKKPVLRHMKGPAPRPIPPPGMEQRDRSVTVMIPRAKYRPMPPLSPHLTMSTFSPDKHLHKTAAQIATEQKLISYLDGNTRIERGEERTTGNVNANGRQQKEQKEQTSMERTSKTYDYKSSNTNVNDSPRPIEKKRESRVYEYEYKMSNMLFSEESNSGDRRSAKSGDDRFRRHSDSTHLNSDANTRTMQFRKYSAGALVSAGYEVSAKVGMHHMDDDTTEDEHSGILNTHTMKSTRSQFTTLNRTGDHKTMSEARSYDETTVHPQTRSLKTHYSGSSPSSRVNNDEGHTMIERDLGSTYIMPESQLFKPEADRGSDISNFDSL